MKKLVYTVITGDYDTLIPPVKSSGWDYVCFTDNPNIPANGWDLQLVPKTSNPCKQQRQLKIRANQLPYDLTVYFDANFHIYRPIDLLLKRHYKSGLLTCKHDSRTLLSEESFQIVRLKKDTQESVRNHMEMLNRQNIPDECGMFSTGFLVRQRSEQITLLETIWSELLDKGSHRDQLSLGPAAHLTSTNIQTITRTELRRYARLLPHKRQ